MPRRNLLSVSVKIEAFQPQLRMQRFCDTNIGRHVSTIWAESRELEAIHAEKSSSKVNITSLIHGKVAESRIMRQIRCYVIWALNTRAKSGNEISSQTSDAFQTNFEN